MTGRRRIALNELTLDHYRDSERFRWEKERIPLITSAGSMTFEPKLEGHSDVGIITFYDNSVAELERFFVKQYTHTSDPSSYYEETHNPNADFSHEKNVSVLICFNVDKHLVPRVSAKSDLDLATVFEHIPEPSDHTTLLEARNSGDERRRLDLIYDAAKRIGYLDGRVKFREDIFLLPYTSNLIRENSGVKRVLDYLIKIMDYKLRITEGLDLPQTEVGFKDYINKHYHVNLDEAISGIIKPSLVLEGKLQLQHGDLRVHHKKGSKFVDLASFGLKPQGYDLATYINAEAGISRPPKLELIKFLAHFLVYEKASSIRTARRRKDALRKLDLQDVSQASREISSLDLNTFIMRFIYQDIVENLHIDSSNKRYSEAQLAQYFKFIPRYTKDQMMAQRLLQVREDFELIADLGLIRVAVENSDVVKRTYNGLVELLVRLELVDVNPEVMEKLSR